MASSPAAEPAPFAQSLGKDWLDSARKQDLGRMKQLLQAGGKDLARYRGKGTSYGFVGNSALHCTPQRDPLPKPTSASHASPSRVPPGAAAKNNCEMAQWLLSPDVEADVDAGNSDGATPLHSAAANNSTAMVKFLLERGADPAATDGLGESPRDAAMRRGYSSVVAVFDSFSKNARLRQACDALRGLPEDQWTIKAMRDVLSASTSSSIAGLTEKGELRDAVRAVLLDQSTAATWYKGATSKAAASASAGDESHARGPVGSRLRRTPASFPQAAQGEPFRPEDGAEGEDEGDSDQPTVKVALRKEGPVEPKSADHSGRGSIPKARPQERERSLVSGLSADGDDEDDDSEAAARAVETSRAAGNKAFGEGDFVGAFKHYTRAIALDGTNYVLYSNRSGAACILGDAHTALGDAQRCVDIAPQWAKGYGRLGKALVLQGNFDEAIDMIKWGLQLERDNAWLQNALDEATRAKETAENVLPAPGAPPQVGPAAPPVEPDDAAWIELAKAGTLKDMRGMLANDPEKKLLRVQGDNALGHTALHWASAHNNEALAEWLLDQGKGATGERGGLGTVMYLLAKGSLRRLAGTPVDIVNKMGATPLHSAAANGSIAIVHMLSRRGASVHARNAAGETAVDLAAARGYPRCLAGRAFPHALAHVSISGRPPPAPPSPSPRRLVEVLQAMGGKVANGDGPAAKGKATAHDGAAPKAERYTRDSLRHKSYEELIGIVLSLQARLEEAVVH